MLIICYTENNEQKFETSNSLEDFKNSKPNTSVLYIFDEEADLKRQESRKSENFMTYCGYYGFSTNDYEAPMLDGKGRELFLVGFSPRNRKYKCLAVDKHTGKRYKMTPAWAKQCMDKYKKAIQTQP